MGSLWDCIVKVLSVVGARPQFIKAAPVSRALRKAGVREYLVHTGQHYDLEMSRIFFDELEIPSPDVNLNVGSGTHAYQTGQMLIGLEEEILEQKPDLVIVFGDTNSTLAAALAACKMQLPIAHVEAGLRSFNRSIPEEHNRVLTDHCSELLFCPSQTAVTNLAREGITRGVHLVGDLTYDAVLQFSVFARERSSILNRLKLNGKKYALATIHRPGNTDDPERLRVLIEALSEIEMPVVFPVHPRTGERLGSLAFELPQEGLLAIEPTGYLDMLCLEQQASLILTDSGGMQKEAFFFGVPCITLRSETEWVETVEEGWNVRAGTKKERILDLARSFHPKTARSSVYGTGHAAELCVETLIQNLERARDH